MRLTLDVDRDPAGRFEGSVQAPATGTGVGFSGILELLHVLEELLDHGTPTGPGPARRTPFPDRELTDRATFLTDRATPRTDPTTDATTEATS